MRIRAPMTARIPDGLVWQLTAVGLDAGRGTTPVTGVASAVHPEGPGRLAPPRRSRTSASAGSNATSLSHAVSLAEATCEV
jgi:hypothetical protein